MKRGVSLEIRMGDRVINASVSGPTDDSIEDLILSAVHAKDLDAAKFLAAYSRNGFGDCLHRSIIRNDKCAIETLLSIGASPNDAANRVSLPYNGDTMSCPRYWFPLSLAACLGNFEIFRLLSRHGASMSDKHNDEVIEMKSRLAKEE
jgi:ankyrin repeat protein